MNYGQQPLTACRVRFPKKYGLGPLCKRWFLLRRGVEYLQSGREVDTGDVVKGAIPTQLIVVVWYPNQTWLSHLDWWDCGTLRFVQLLGEVWTVGVWQTHESPCARYPPLHSWFNKQMVTNIPHGVLQSLCSTTMFWSHLFWLWLGVSCTDISGKSEVVQFFYWLPFRIHSSRSIWNSKPTSTCFVSKWCPGRKPNSVA